MLATDRDWCRVNQFHKHIISFAYFRWINRMYVIIITNWIDWTYTVKRNRETATHVEESMTHKWSIVVSFFLSSNVDLYSETDRQTGGERERERDIETGKEETHKHILTHLNGHTHGTQYNLYVWKSHTPSSPIPELVIVMFQ